MSLPEPLASALPKSLDQWRAAGNVRRLWAGDSSLWTGADENKWLGWLDITRQQLAQVDQLVALAQEIKDAGFADAVLLGMGGSSLCPAVMRPPLELSLDSPGFTSSIPPTRRRFSRARSKSTS